MKHYGTQVHSRRRCLSFKQAEKVNPGLDDQGDLFSNELSPVGRPSLKRKTESDLKDLLKTLVGSANSVMPNHVAAILIGEKDDGTAQGVEKIPTKSKRRFAEKQNEFIRPSSFVQCNTKRTDCHVSEWRLNRHITHRILAVSRGYVKGP